MLIGGTEGLRGSGLRLLDGPTAHDFIKGLFKAIGETKDTKDLLQCAKNLESVIEKIHEALKRIMHLSIQDLILGFGQLLGALAEFNAAVKPCSNGYNTFNKLIDAIHSIDIFKIIQKVMQNTFFYVGYASSAIECFNKNLYECVGKCIGIVLKELFLS